MAGGLTNAFLTEMAKWAIAESAPTQWSNANAYLGVGDSSTAYAAAQTDLQASTNKLRKAMYDGTFPSRSGLALTFKSKFLAAEANFDWNEVACFNASSSGTMLYRDVLTSFWTKPNTQEWHLTSVLTLSAA
jgi:hypothetical protein